MHQTRRQKVAFTLVELLVVIALIGLLIGILLPSMAAVRRSARNTATRATLQTLATGLENFKADGQLGGAYPPSMSDRGGATPASLNVRSPYVANGPDIQISGAGLLVWALAGADLLGTPGFKVFRTNSPPSTSWSQDTDATYNSGDPTQSGAYGVPIDPNMPLPHPRSGPYVDLERIPLTPRDPNGFVIKSENNAVGRGYPMFLDTFGFPILYWRADPAGRAMADQQPGASGGPRGLYHWSDNCQLLDANVSGSVVLQTDGSSGTKHRLGWNSDPNVPGYFQAYIRNQEVQAKPTPLRPDSFLLVSPGADGAYGTGDDVTNFEHGGG